LACEADARQALSTFERDWHTIDLAARTVRAPPRDRTRGRPGPDARPHQVVYQIAGALAATRTSRQALLDQHGCVILATNALDHTPLPPHEMLAGDTGQVHVERGCRLLQDPQFFDPSRSLNKPERIMALLMVMTVCWLVYAALAYRIRPACTDHAATFPDPRGQRIHHPTARWVCHDVVGIHV
jgi:transposase